MLGSNPALALAVRRSNLSVRSHPQGGRGQDSQAVPPRGQGERTAKRDSPEDREGERTAKRGRPEDRQGAGQSGGTAERLSRVTGQSGGTAKRTCRGRDIQTGHSDGTAEKVG